MDLDSENGRAVSAEVSGPEQDATSESVRRHPGAGLRWRRNRIRQIPTEDILRRVENANVRINGHRAVVEVVLIRTELLVLRCQRQDRAGLQELVSTWEGRLYYYIRRLVEDDEPNRPGYRP